MSLDPFSYCGSKIRISCHFRGFCHTHVMKTSELVIIVYGSLCRKILLHFWVPQVPSLRENCTHHTATISTWKAFFVRICVIRCNDVRLQILSFQSSFQSQGCRYLLLKVFPSNHIVSNSNIRYYIYIGQFTLYVPLCNDRGSCWIITDIPD